MNRLEEKSGSDLVSSFVGIAVFHGFPRTRTIQDGIALLLDMPAAF